jgi:hypothetical protein
MSQKLVSIRFLIMSTCFWSLGTAPVFHFDIAKSKFGITEINLFFLEPPDRASPSFGDGFFYVRERPRPNDVRGLSPLPRAKRHSK